MDDKDPLPLEYATPAAPQKEAASLADWVFLVLVTGGFFAAAFSVVRGCMHPESSPFP